MPRLARPVLLLVVSALLVGCVAQPAARREAAPGDEAAPPGPIALLEAALASESSAATSPVDPDHLLVVSHAPRAGPGLGASFAVHVSRDGGATWATTRLGPEDLFEPPHSSRFTGFSDPAVAFGPDGTAYLAGLAYLPDTAVWVARSEDGRNSWRARLVSTGNLASDFHDKEWIAVSPVTGTLLVSWQSEPALDSLRDVELATGLDVDVGHIMLARSTDRGESWSRPAQVSRGLHNNGTQVAFSPDGTAHLLWVNYESPGLDHARSEDDGLTWSTPRQVTDVAIVGAYPRFARMHTLPALAASPVSADLFAIWHDARHGDADVLALASRDGGRTWIGPVRLGPGAEGDGVIQLYPWAAVDPEGDLWVSYYDATPDPSGPLFRFAIQPCDPRLVCGEVRSASAGPFEVFAPTDGSRGALSIGDYTSLTTTPSAAFPVWTEPGGDGPVLRTVAMPRADGSP